MSFRKLAVTIVVAVVALVFFNLSRRPMVSDAEARFIAWNTETREKLRSASPEGGTGSISLTVEHLRPVAQGAPEDRIQRVIEYPDQSNPGRNAELRTRISRLLELFQEASVFGFPDTGSAAEPSYRFVIKHQDVVFDRSVRAADFQNNIQGQNLLTLFELYAGEKSKHPEMNPGQL